MLFVGWNDYGTVQVLQYSSIRERIQSFNTTKSGESYFFSTLNCIKDILLKEKRHKLQAVCICAEIVGSNPIGGMDICLL